jgi:5-methylcytosine-specific restriction endonuclease McrA
VPARWLRRQRGCGILSAEVVTAPTDRDTTRPAPDETGRAALEAGPAPGGDASAGRAAGLAADAAEHAGPEPVSAPETTSPRGVEPRALTDLSAARVLILNASYEPLHVCSVKRAVNLLMQEIVERVEDAERVLRTPSDPLRGAERGQAATLRARPHRQRVAFNRRTCSGATITRCQYCGGAANDLTLDHVVPRSRGGPTSWENVVACCRRCNARKRDRTPEEARMALTRQAGAPTFLFTAAYGMLPDIDPTWEKYLPVALR